jgi:DNA repair proteins
MNRQKLLKDNDIQITGSLDAARALCEEFAGLDHEETWALFLTTANRPLMAEMITCGTLRSTLIDHRRIVKQAILCDAAGVILYHNHPSGLPRPSAEDIRQTETLKKACDLFDISLLDHIIFGSDRFFSFSDETEQKLK